MPIAPPVCRAVLLTAEARPERSAGPVAMAAATTAGVSSPQPVPHSRNAGSSSAYPEWAGTGRQREPGRGDQ
ncbi:hypothetical protein OHQ89_05710 [Streptomyces canus]